MRLMSIILIILISFANGCLRREIQPLNIIMLVDCSTSVTSDIKLKEKNIRVAGEWWANKVTTKYRGGRFKVLAINRSISDVVVFWEYSAPRRFHGPLISKQQAQWRDEFQKALTTKIKELSQRLGSGIIEGIFRASEQLDMLQPPKILIIHTDLRQVTGGVWNFEKSVPKYDIFKEWIKREHLEPHFDKETKIIVCGFKPYMTNLNTTTIKTSDYHKLKTLWQSLFNDLGKAVDFVEELQLDILEDLLKEERK